MFNINVKVKQTQLIEANTAGNADASSRNECRYFHNNFRWLLIQVDEIIRKQLKQIICKKQTWSSVKSQSGVSLAICNGSTSSINKHGQI